MCRLQCRELQSIGGCEEQARNEGELTSRRKVSELFPQRDKSISTPIPFP